MKRLATILTRQETSIGSAAFIIMTMVFTSRVLGLVRDRLLNARFYPHELGVYLAAFRLPNLLFELLVLGALTSAFIPVFTKLLNSDRGDEAQKMTAALINISVIVLLFVSVPFFIWAPQISRFLTPGFTENQVAQMASFTRYIIYFQVVPLLIGNYFTGVLQSHNLFLVPALAPVVYNLGIIIGIIFFSGIIGLYAPVVGVGIGAALFMLIQLPLVLATGYRHRLTLDLSLPGVREVGKLMAPRTLGLAVSQIDSTVDLAMASLLGSSMVTVFNYAQQLQQLPIGLFGATIAQAALPTLSKASAKADLLHFKKTVTTTLHQILFLVLPASVLFMVLRVPVVRLVFGAAKFDWEATVLTGMTLSAFSISLAFQAMVHVLARGFYAVLDTRTPVAIGIFSIVLNVIGSVIFILVWHLPVWALGISTSIASCVNASLLLFFLDRRIGHFGAFELFWPPLKMVLASVVTGVMLYVPLKLFDQLVFDTTRTFGLIMLTLTVTIIGLATYVFLAWVLEVGEVRSLFNLLAKVRRPKALIIEPVQEIIDGGGGEQLT